VRRGEKREERSILKSKNIYTLGMYEGDEDGELRKVFADVFEDPLGFTTSLLILIY